MNILIVDDERKNLKLLEVLLYPNYNVFKAIDGTSALDILNTNKVDLVLLDIMMPGMSGYEVCSVIKKNKSTIDIPVIMLTSLNDDESQVKGLSLGAADFITKPFKLEVLEARVKTQLSLKKAQDELKNFNSKLKVMVKERTRELEVTQEVTIECMASLAGYRDIETGYHIKRTQTYVKELAIQLKEHPKFKDYLDDTTIEMLYISAPLHDIGKVAIPDAILLKPDKLTDEEFAIMKNHPVIGCEAIAKSEKRLKGNSFLRFAREVAVAHHEKWDGSGYPYGLKGDNIPIPGRLMAIADVYDALVTKRPYKEPFSHEKAVGIITEGRGTHFDPEIVDAFLSVQDKFRKIALRLSDDKTK
ncbi:MAG TPA: two-component system response regulator [Lentisphaeria bacterium]|nr:MAG: two-component system response regulator [Lentisphaerae bacterium GWF2_38_69]HBM17385.1 two-component system response regulator [Lentisphaeria bacterium]